MKKVLVSFDVDGTLEFGDPPGPITVDMVRRARELGCIIGSCSDRTLAGQRELWERHKIEVEFTVLKHNLSEVRMLYEADCYYHIGDTDLDRQFALAAGFGFWWMYEAASEPWAALVNGQE